MQKNSSKSQDKLHVLEYSKADRVNLNQFRSHISELSKIVLDRKVAQGAKVESLKEILSFGEDIFSIRDRLKLIDNLLKQKSLVDPYFLSVKTIEKDIRQKQKTRVISKVEDHIALLQMNHKTFNNERYSELKAEVKVFRQAEKLGSNSFKGAGRYHFFWTYVILQKYLETGEINYERNRHINNEFLRSVEPLVTLKPWNKFEQGSRKAKSIDCMLYATIFGVFNDVDFNDDACRAVLTFGIEMAGNFDQRVISTKNFLAELKNYNSQKAKDVHVKDNADQKLREEFQRNRSKILKQSPLGTYNGEGFVNNRWA